jgi:uncharacterized MAPEG superfamily protein
MLLAAALMPYVTVALAKSGGFDNRTPRPSLENLTGWHRRAEWAHRNHFEAFPIFAAAVFVAELTHAPQGRIDLLAAFSYFYGLSTRRSTSTTKPRCGRLCGCLP